MRSDDAPLGESSLGRKRLPRRRSAADVQPSLDLAKRTITVAGTAVQIATADWLVRRLDLPPEAPLSGVQEYRSPADADDVVRVFYLTHASTPQSVQEIVSTIRSVADVRRLSIYTTLRAVAARGTIPQIALAAWLVDRLDRPPNAPAPPPHEYELPGDDVARVFELTHARTPQQLQELVTVIRSIADIQRIFVYSARPAATVHAPAERVALTAWLMSELDQPAPAPGQHTARIPARE